MGKKLIIKGANFIVNAIQDVDYSTTTLYQMLIYTNPESANYGKIANFEQYICAKIPVALAAGQSVKYFVTNNGSIMTNVISGYILSTSDVAIANGTTIPNIVGNEISINSDDGYFTVTNTTNANAYLYFIFAYAPPASLPVSGKTAYYAILDEE